MELYIEPERPQRDKKGRFIKGYHVASPRRLTPKFYAAIMNNLKKATKIKGRKGLNKCKPVVGIRADKTFVVFPSARLAERELGITRCCVGNRCRGTTKDRWMSGFKWFYEDDDRWMEEVKEDRLW